MSPYESIRLAKSILNKNLIFILMWFVQAFSKWRWLSPKNPINVRQVDYNLFALNSKTLFELFEENRKYLHTRKYKLLTKLTYTYITFYCVLYSFRQLMNENITKFSADYSSPVVWYPYNWLVRCSIMEYELYYIQEQQSCAQVIMLYYYIVGFDENTFSPQELSSSHFIVLCIVLENNTPIVLKLRKHFSYGSHQKHNTGFRYG